VLKHIDLLALHKLNVFHWHLTEDQGWRIEIKRYPKLTEVGAWRQGQHGPAAHARPREAQVLGQPHGGFYTQDDVREVVRYATDRGVTVVPEIEMPGHALAAIAAVSRARQHRCEARVQTYWGISEHVFGVGDNVLKFLENVSTRSSPCSVEVHPRRWR
jgi:hexosaminidase